MQFESIFWRTFMAIQACVLLVAPCIGRAGESHVESIKSELRATVKGLRSTTARTSPGKQPHFLAFWDFDGTILKGDSSEGMTGAGTHNYVGFMEAGIREGFSNVYPANDEGVKKFWEDYNYLDTRIGHWLSYPYLPQLFRGARLSQLEALSERLFARDMKRFFFASSIEIWRECERLGVENHVISAGADFIVQGAARHLGISRDRIHGIRLKEREGRVTEELEYPVTFADGKRRQLEMIAEDLRSSPGTGPVFVVAAFGNSYSTDGPFLRHVQQQTLPSGRPTVVMINGGKPPPAYEQLFRCVEQTAVVGPEMAH